MVIFFSTRENPEIDENEGLSSSSTKNELKKLYDIVNNKDNINLSEKHTDSDYFQDIDSLDRKADDLFNQFFLLPENRGSILSVINGKDTPDQKIEQIQSLFRTFLENLITRGSILPGSYEFENAQTAFLEKYESLLLSENYELQDIIDVSLLELQLLKTQLTPINSGGSTGSTEIIGYGNYWKEGYESEFTNDLYSSSYRSSESFDIELAANNYHFNDDFIDKYDDDISYLNVERTKSGKFKTVNDYRIKNIYRSGGDENVLSKIFNKEALEKISRNDFSLNLGLDNGLAHIILEMDNIIKRTSKPYPETDTLSSILFAIEQDRIPDANMKDKMDIKRLKSFFIAKNIVYKNKDSEYSDYENMVKIFNNSTWKDLLTFAHVIQSRKNSDRAIKEWFNAQEIVELSDPKNVFEYLCDYNSDGIISAIPEGAVVNKEQFKVGDVGNISGQQLLFTIGQAIETQDILLGKGKGEPLVIQNIVDMIQVMDTRKISKAPLAAFDDISYCTKENLHALLTVYPELKLFFVSAIEKFAGGAATDQMDLYEILTGQTGKRFENVDLWQEQEELRKKIDLAIKNNPAIGTRLTDKQQLELRETLLIKTMKHLDGFEFVFSLGEKTIIDNAVSYAFYKAQAKKDLIKDLDIKNIEHRGGIGTNLEDISLSYTWKEKNSDPKGGKRWAIQGGPVAYINPEQFKFGAGFSVGGNYLEQINKNAIISGSLDSVVQKAEYLGAEAAAGGKIGTENGLFAYLGVKNEKDAVEGISQLAESYSYVSNILFSVPSDINCDNRIVKNHIIAKLNEKNIWGPYQDFVTNNRNKLINDINQIFRFLEQDNLLEEINKTKKPVEALQTLLRILQDGNVQQRKGDVIMNLHGKLALTGFSMGISANLWFFGKGKANIGGGESNSGVDVSPNGMITQDRSGSTTFDPAIENPARGRFSFGPYFRVEFSTWKNKYIPNAGQLLKTEHEIATGIALDEMDFQDDMEKYADYLQALFNKEGLTVTYITDENDKNYKKLVVHYESKASLLSGHSENLEDVLNIYYLPGTECQFSLDDDNTLTIGNVEPRPIARTVTMNHGINRILCLGTDKLNDAIKLVAPNNNTSPLDEISLRTVDYKSFERLELEKQIRESELSLPIQNLFLGLFNNEGRLIKKEKYTYGKPIIAGQKFSTGTLKLIEHENEYYLSYAKSSPSDKLALEYQKLETRITYIPIENTDSKSEAGQEYNNNGYANNETNILDGLINFSGTGKSYMVFNDINFIIDRQDNYPKLEYSNGAIKPAFKEFMQYVVNPDLDKAVKNLKEILGSYHQISEILDDCTAEEKLFIVDRYLAIFAKEASYERQTIGQILDSRGNTYLGLTGPGKLKFENNLSTEIKELKKQARGNIKNEKYLDVQNSNNTPINLFGYTAFYRRAVPNQGHGYAATALGNTNIISGSRQEFSQENTISAKEWIIANLKKDPVHAELLKNSINKHLAQLLPSSFQLSQQDIFDLILNNEIIKKLDISYKKIILNSAAVFYLLKECANESLGLEFGKLSIKTVDENGNEIPGGGDGNGNGEEGSGGNNENGEEGGDGNNENGGLIEIAETITTDERTELIPDPIYESFLSGKMITVAGSPVPKQKTVAISVFGSKGTDLKKNTKNDGNWTGGDITDDENRQDTYDLNDGG